MPLPKQGTEYTYEDYLTWPEDERWEIIEGVPYMQAAPSSIHQEISMELSTQIAAYLRGKLCKVYAAPFCVRFTKGIEMSNNQVKNVVEPDISVICDRSKIDKQGCNGAPDMIIEILSPSTARADRFLKFNLYEKNGVTEYWLVDPEQKIISVHILQVNHKYGIQVFDEKAKIPVSIFEDLKIDIGTVFPV